MKIGNLFNVYVSIKQIINNSRNNNLNNKT